MKRKLLLADLALLALSAAGVAHLRHAWIEARGRDEAVLRKRIQPVPPPPLTPPPAVDRAKRASYSDIARKLLFSEDRNAEVVIETTPPKLVPMPALPLFHGVVDLGDGPMAILSDGPSGPHRDYQPGDKAGPFKLVAVNNEELELEWEGRKITKRLDKIPDRSVSPASGQMAAAAAATAVPPARPLGPGADLGRGIKACQPGDTSPSGTIVDGMRKAIKPSPLGSKCYWETAN